MKRYAKPLAVGCALGCALFLTIKRQGPDGQLGLTTQPSSRAAPPRVAKHYDLSALKVFRIVLGRVTDSYVDPERIKPREMLLAALDAVEKSVAEVLVKESEDKRKVTVRVQDVSRTFDVSNVDSPWALSSVIKRVLRFIQPHLHPSTEIRDVEYAAVNGMLQTLDPHSILLSPDIYNEMKLSTQGHFGGLGIVIAMVNGVLTVMNPIKGTPADQAGVKACDKILKIGEESTVNMTLGQAVKRLRGVPGSKVVVTIARAGWPQPGRKTLTRAIIKVESVESRLLSKKIGYIRLKSFQGNSHADLQQHLAKLRASGMRGLVLDLRGNPGGLLDQAIRISDLFVDAGTLLTTVSHAGKRREEKRAHREGTEDRYPIAVLVNSGSASASEIVAGALKNLDRGVIIGTKTFGKGTVQVLYDNADGSALKLTIAQYLTPGDISIQTVGITPDVETDGVAVTPRYVVLKERHGAPREKDLRQHLTHANAAANVKPLRTLRYIAREAPPTSEQKKAETSKNLCRYPDRSCKPPKEDKFVEDFQIRLGRDLLAQAKGWRRSQILANAEPFFKKVEQAQEQEVVASLRKVGVDWSAGETGGKPKLAVVISTDPPGGKAAACRRFKLKVRVTNEGKAPVFRLRGVTESTNRLLSKRELVFGRLDPGQSRSWEVPIKVRDALTRIDELSVRLFDGHGTKYGENRTQIAVKGVRRPVFAYGYQLVDDVKGNLDGKAQRGEELRLFVRVKNTGTGPAFRAMTQLKNLSGAGVFIRKGRFVLGGLAPGGTKTASFTLWLKPNYQQDTFKVELMVLDDGLREYVSEKLEFKVANASDSVAGARGYVRAKAGAALRSWADPAAPAVGVAAGRGSFKVLGRVGGWYRVLAGPAQPAFVAANEVFRAAAPPGRGAFVPRWQVTPPSISLNVPTYATDKAVLRISGTARDETRVSDLYVFVRNTEAKIGSRKVFYRSNRHSKSPKELGFETDVPLWPGTNYVSVFARESNDTQAQETVVIFRRKQSNPLAQAPKAKSGAAGSQQPATGH